MAKPKRPTPPRPPVDTSAIGACYGDWGENFPLVTGYLCDATYEDGSLIGPTRLSFRRDLCRIRVKLQLETGGLCLEAVGDTPDRALASLEGLLLAPDTPWQKDLWPIGQRSKKK